MGAHSSWSMFTLCHHIVAHYCFYTVRNELPSQMDYSILGDDIVLVGKDFSAKYIEVMNQLGVSISEQKSHVSNDTFEFAKRWIRRGVEVSPYPVEGLIESAKRITLLAGFLVDTAGRGYCSPPLRGPCSLESLLGLIVGK